MEEMNILGKYFPHRHILKDYLWSKKDKMTYDWSLVSQNFVSLAIDIL